MIPPSIIIPAKSSGCMPLFSVSSLSSLVLLTICLSRTRWSICALSTTRNHVPFPAVFKASISNSVQPWVTAVLKSAKLSLRFLCPVKSLNP